MKATSTKGYYAVFSRSYTELRFFRLTEDGYREDLTHSGRVWLPEAGLGLGVWHGSYQGIAEHLWLRWYDANGNWIPTYEESATQERLRREEAEAHVAQERVLADEARACADQERARAERLLEMLRQLGYNPE